MKTKRILSLSFILFFCLILNPIASSAYSENCSGTIIVHSYPHVKGKWCGNGLTGEFTTDANGIATISSLCYGNYIICVFSDSGIVTSDVIFNNNFYDCYVLNNNNAPLCPCN